jgi:hypothetical protein
MGGDIFWTPLLPTNNTQNEAQTMMLGGGCLTAMRRHLPQGKHANTHSLIELLFWIFFLSAREMPSFIEKSPHQVSLRVSLLLPWWGARGR